MIINKFMETLLFTTTTGSMPTLVKNPKFFDNIPTILKEQALEFLLEVLKKEKPEIFKETK